VSSMVAAATRITAQTATITFAGCPMPRIVRSLKRDDQRQPVGLDETRPSHLGVALRHQNRTD
jgi:hypothetical protein